LKNGKIVWVLGHPFRRHGVPISLDPLLQINQLVNFLGVHGSWDVGGCTIWIKLKRFFERGVLEPCKHSNICHVEVVKHQAPWFRMLVNFQNVGQQTLECLETRHPRVGFWLLALALKFGFRLGLCELRELFFLWLEVVLFSDWD
jgi:hypothetical protein